MAGDGGNEGQVSTIYLLGLKSNKGENSHDWKGLDAANGSLNSSMTFCINCHREKIEFTKAHPNRKNDSAYIEQKNWTQVRKILGYLSYDTFAELSIINDLYRGDLRLYKNFLWPVMKLTEKTRIGSSINRKHDIPKTPYKRLRESNQISDEAKA